MSSNSIFQLFQHSNPPLSPTPSPMGSNTSLHPFQYSNTFSPTMPPGTESMYYHPAGYPGTYTEYNTHWGLGHQQELVQNADQFTSQGPFATGLAATVDNDAHQCRWWMGDIPCDQECANFDELMKHLGHVHDVRGSATRELICQWMSNEEPCGKQRRRHGFRRHIGKHLGQSIACTDCDKSFSRRDTMRAHWKKEHAK
ncbi:hypothetical protein HD554DRAFT_1157170 [Boletus coccyginus]|nr:hypothetical protein HD554DRAFT_1157170 [Boletus coccyginus]